MATITMRSGEILDSDHPETWPEGHRPPETSLAPEIVSIDTARTIIRQQQNAIDLLRDQLTDALPSSKTRPAVDLPDLRDVFESLQDTTVYPFLVDRMFRLGYFALLAAYESTGKSYVATQIAMSVISGRSVFGEFPTHEPMGVCVFDMEMGEAEDRNRDRSMMADLHIEPDTIQGFYRRVTLDDAFLSLKNPAHVEYIGAQLDKANAEMDRPILCILDSTDSLHSKHPWGDDADSLDAAIATLREGRRDWLVILLLIHTKKKPQVGKADYARDLEDVIGNATRQADMVMVLDVRGDYALRCLITKRPGRSRGILQREPEGFAWTWTKDEGDTSTKVAPTDALVALRALCAESKDGHTTAHMVAFKLNVSVNTAKAYLGKLEAAGQVESTSEGTQRGRVEFWPKAVEG